MMPRYHQVIHEHHDQQNQKAEADELWRRDEPDATDGGAVHVPPKRRAEVGERNQGRVGSARLALEPVQAFVNERLEKEERS
jgi:hypothetical protein